LYPQAADLQKRKAFRESKKAKGFIFLSFY